MKTKNDKPQANQTLFNENIAQANLDISKWLFDNINSLNFAQVKACIEKGANVNYIDSGFKNSVLIEYCFRGCEHVSLDIVKLLVLSGADINYGNYANRNVLFSAMTNNRGAKLVELLLNLGANPYAVDASNRDSVAVALDYAMVNCESEKNKGYIAKTHLVLDKCLPTDILKVKNYLRLIHFHRDNPVVIALHEKLTAILDKLTLEKSLPQNTQLSTKTHKI